MFFNNAEHFETITEAFAACRDRGRSMTVRIGPRQMPELQQPWHVFPAGRAELMHVTPTGRIAKGGRV